MPKRLRFLFGALRNSFLESSPDILLFSVNLLGRFFSVNQLFFLKINFEANQQWTLPQFVLKKKRLHEASLSI